MESSANSPARTAERVLFYTAVPVFVLALWPYTINPCEPPKLVVMAFLTLCCAVLAFFDTSESVRGSREGASISAGRSGGAGLRGLLLLWLGWQLVCGLASTLPENSLRSLLQPALWVLAALAARRAFSDAVHAWRLAAVIVGALTAASLYGFAQHFGWDPFPWGSKDIVEYRGLPSTFGNPNFAGHALVPGILLAVGLATRPRGRVPAIAALIIMTTHLWLTGMRGGPLALAAAAVLFGSWWLSGRVLGARGGRIPLALLLALLAGLAATCAGIAAYRMTHDTWMPMSDSSLDLRYNSVYGASRMLVEHPLTGIGPGNYERLVADWWTPFEQRWYAVRGLRNDHVHFEPLEAAAEGGLPGLFLHLLLFTWALLAGLRLARDGTNAELKRFGLMTALCVVAMGVDGLFGFNLHVPVSACLLFVLVGVLDGLIGATLPPVCQRSSFLGFAGKAFVTALAVAVLAGSLLRFRADAAALRDQGMQGQMGALSVDDPGFQGVKNALLQHALKDRRDFPNDPRFPAFLGRGCMAAGHFTAAEDAFKDALVKYPANPDLLADLSRALHGQAAEHAARGDWRGTAFLLQRAKIAAERSRKLCPDLAAPHDALWRIADLRAETARQMGLDGRAQEERTVLEARAALQCGVEDVAPVYRTLARIALRAQGRDEAADCIGRALDAGPASPETWALVGVFEQDIQGHLKLLDAVSRAYAVLRQLPSQRPVFLLAAWWMMRTNSECSGMPLAVARDAVRTAPDEPGAWGLLANTPEGAMDLARLICAEKTQLAAERPDAFAPALVDTVCADPPPAAEVIIQAASTFAKNTVNLGGPALKDRVRRELAWGVPLLKRTAVKCGATPADLSRILASCADVYGAAEMWTEAEAACTEALPAAEPDAQVTLQLLRSRALERLSRREEALAAAREAAQRAPGRLDVQWNLAQRLSESGMDKEAQFVYKMLLQAVPPNRPEYGRIADECAGVLQRLQASAPGASP